MGADASRAISARKKKERIDAYAANPNLCPGCTNAISYERRNNKFCTASCAASSSNIRSKKSHVCLNCGEARSNSKTKYCSNACQHLFQRSETHRKLEAGENGLHRQVRDYLIAKHGMTCLDPLCAWDFAKRPINVELEHIDGNHENNTLTNCTLLCPNCHSTTPTYKNKNKGNGRAARRQRYAEGKSW